MKEESTESQNAESPRNRPRTQGGWWPTGIVVGVFLLAAIPMILTQHDRGRGRFDQLNYHEPAILRFAEQWPTPDVSNYLSATTPGYHLVIAGVARYISPSLIVLQSAGAVFTVGLLVLLTRWLSARVSPATATLLGLSVIASLYVFSAGVYLLPDNTAWLMVLAIVALSLRPKIDPWTYLGGGTLLLLLVLTRQSHLWAMGVLFAAAWLGPVFAPSRGGFGEIGGLLTSPGRRIGRLTLMLLCALPALAALGWFRHIWGGGLTVPVYQDYMKGPNSATPAIILAQLGVIGAFHIGFWWRSAVAVVRARPGVVAAALLFGLIVLLAPETTYDRAAGRYSGLWNLINKSPDLAGRTNVGVFVLGLGGVVAICGWLSGLDTRKRWVMLGALVGFALAASAPKNAWTRYHEPMLLMWAALASASIACHPIPLSSLTRTIRGVGLAGLCLALASVTGLKLSREARVTEPKWSQPSVKTPLGSLWPESWRGKWGEPTDGSGGEEPGSDEDSPAD